MYQRLRKIREKKQLSQAKFGGMLGLPQSTYAMFETGHRELKEIHIAAICRVFNINRDWLETGKGEMELKVLDDALEVLVQKHQLDELDKIIFTKYVQLNQEDRGTIKRLIIDIAETHKNHLTEKVTQEELSAAMEIIVKHKAVSLRA